MRPVCCFVGGLSCVLLLVIDDRAQHPGGAGKGPSGWSMLVEDSRLLLRVVYAHTFRYYWLYAPRQIIEERRLKVNKDASRNNKG
jgi:hypothetical protein